MTTRYRSQDTEDIPGTQDSMPLDLMQQDHPVVEGENDSSNEHCEETNTIHPLADLLEQSVQLKNQIASLKSTTPQSTPTEELVQPTDKLQCLAMVLHQASHSNEEPVHKTMQIYMDTLFTTKRESNLTTTLLENIPTFDGQDSLKLEDWFMFIETATDILTKSHIYLDEAKSCGLTHTLIF